MPVLDRDSTYSRESKTEGIEVNVIIAAGNWCSVLDPKMASGTFCEDHSIDEENLLLSNGLENKSAVREKGDFQFCRYHYRFCVFIEKDVGIRYAYYKGLGLSTLFTLEKMECKKWGDCNGLTWLLTFLAKD